MAHSTWLMAFCYNTSMHQETKLQDFQAKLQAIYPDTWEKVIQTHYTSKPKTFRINTLYANPAEVLVSLKEDGYDIIPLEEIPSAYICKGHIENKRLAESRVNFENKIYIQEASSMIPALILDPRPGENILDLCAAPGSKTSQIQVMTRNEANLVAIEKSRSRFFTMKKILEEQKIKHVRILLEDANRVPYNHPEFIGFFDKILLDAPCSTEGQLDLNNPMGLKLWSLKEASKIAKLQKGLINTAIKMLKKGGTLIYSTCTYSLEENEIVLDWALRKNEELRIKNVELKKVVTNKNEINIPNIQAGLTSWRDRQLNPEVKNSIRIIPNEIFTSFFLSKLQKN
jgi:16S rRNA C967 or C1407 C5-methylase (RsmB/RsmF family)